LLLHLRPQLVLLLFGSGIGGLDSSDYALYFLLQAALCLLHSGLELAQHRITGLNFGSEVSALPLKAGQFDLERLDQAIVDHGR
jgi:hypothetical protein